jgi:hypothetical protein
VPKGDVGGGEGGGECVAGEGASFRGRKQNERGGDGEEQDDVKGGKDASGAALVKAEVAEGAAADVGVDLAADEVAGDDEEDVDAGESAGDEGDAGVVEDDGKYGEGAKAVYVRAIGMAGLGGGCFGWRGLNGG